MAGCGASSASSTGSAKPQLTGHIARGTDTYVVPLAYCTSPRLDESQLNLTACAGEEASNAGARLSRALSVESTYYGTTAIAAVQARWARFVSAECSLEIQESLGGSEYYMLASSCIEGFEHDRLTEIDEVLRTLRPEQSPTHPAGRLPIDIHVRPNVGPLGS